VRDAAAAPGEAGSRGSTEIRPGLRITHFAQFLASLGGQQSILRHQLDHDAARGIDYRAVILFDRPGTTPDARVHALGLTGYDSIGETRRRVRACLGDRPTDVAVYHDLFALPFAADLDHAATRIGTILCPIPPVLRILRENADLVDGVIGLGPPTVAAVRRELPALPPERLHWVPVPVPSAPPVEPRRPLADRPFVLGYSGRIERPIKRVDRLPGLLRRLEAEGLDPRLEVLGEGPAREWLARQLGAGRVRFHGFLSGPAYWRVLGGWDAVVYVSDAEGFGISLLEGMSVGALPLYPAIDGGAESYVRAVDPDLLYPPDDWGHVARVVRRLRQAPDRAIDALRARARELVAPHHGDGHEQSFWGFVGAVTARPRISRAAFSDRPRYLSDRWPYGILRRVYPRAFWRNRPVPRPRGESARARPGLA
jgi:glycosyltransferase involved in cell wall biosynthesis